MGSIPITRSNKKTKAAHSGLGFFQSTSPTPGNLMKPSGIYAEIYARIAADTSLFPCVPEKAIKLKEKLQDPNCDVALATQVIKTDPGLAAFLLRTASSVSYLTRVPPQDLESAVRRIGLTDTYNFALTYIARSLFSAPLRRVNTLLRDVYSNATKIAVIGSFLAPYTPAFNAGKAMLAGLLQDIGVPAILSCLAENKALFQDPEKREGAIDELAPLVGVLILKEWGFDEELLEVARSRKDWLRDKQEQPDLADLILIARLHALIGTPAFRDCPPLTDMPAYHKLSLGELSPDNSLQLLEDSRQELREIQRLFGV